MQKFLSTALVGGGSLIRPNMTNNALVRRCDCIRGICILFATANQYQSLLVPTTVAASRALLLLNTTTAV